MASTTLEIILSARDNASGSINRVAGSLNSLNATAGRVGRGVGQVGAGLLRVGAIAGTVAAGGLIAAAKAAGTFEAQLNTINTIVHLTPANLSKVGDGLREFARAGRGELADLSTAFYDVLSAGITDTSDALKVLDASSRLAIGGLSTNAQAVDLLTTAINAYGQKASEAAADADLFAKAIEIGKVTADEIAASFASIAPIAAQTGINIEEVAAAYGALTAQGTNASEVSTQMARAILDLLSPGKELLELQGKLGVSFMEMAREKGLVVALQAMRDAVDGDEAAFKALFGRVEGYKFALQTTGPQQKIYNAALKAMGEAAGTASEQMAERTKGLNFQVGRLKANIIDAGISIGQGFTPALARMADKLSTFVATNRPELEDFGRQIGAALDRIDLDKLLTQAKTFASVFRTDVLPVIKGIADIIGSLPEQVKVAGASFLVLNKLSGGLIGAGAGNIIGGLGGAAVRGVAARIPGIGGVFAQPVYVTNFPLGMGVGGAGGAGTAAAAGGLAGTAAALLKGGLIVAGGVIVANIIREIAGITPEESAERQSRGQFGPRSASNLPTPPGSLIPRAPGAPRDQSLIPRAPGAGGALAVAATSAKHGQLATMLNAGGLSSFREDALASGMWNKRIQYLRGAAGRGGAGAAGKQFDEVVSRDIKSLQAQQGTASSDQKAKLAMMITLLTSIRDKNDFGTFEVPAPIVTVNVQVPVTIRDIERKRTMISRIGRIVAY